MLVRPFEESFDDGRDDVKRWHHPVLSLAHDLLGEQGVLHERDVLVVIRVVAPRAEARIRGNEEIERILRLWHRVEALPPNGSRLSCGRNARWRKAVEPQTKRLVGEATQFLPTCERPAASSAC